MGPLGTLAVSVVMLVGLLGVLVPVLPGLPLVWAAGLVWVLLDGGGPTRWTVLAVMTVLAAAGSLAPYVLSGRSARARGAPASTLALGVLGAVGGFFVVPVVGLLVGGVAGIYLAEWRRLGSALLAWTSTLDVLRAVGVGILLELVAGLLMVATWGLGLLLT